MPNFDLSGGPDSSCSYFQRSGPLSVFEVAHASGNYGAILQQSDGILDIVVLDEPMSQPRVSLQRVDSIDSLAKSGTNSNRQSQRLAGKEKRCATEMDEDEILTSDDEVGVENDGTKKRKVIRSQTAQNPSSNSQMAPSPTHISVPQSFDPAVFLKAMTDQMNSVLKSNSVEIGKQIAAAVSNCESRLGDKISDVEKKAKTAKNTADGVRKDQALLTGRIGTVEGKVSTQKVSIEQIATDLKNLTDRVSDLERENAELKTALSKSNTVEKRILDVERNVDRLDNNSRGSSVVINGVRNCDIQAFIEHMLRMMDLERVRVADAFFIGRDVGARRPLKVIF
jgi:uncharacterized coiled-coil protein SlyX